jgi:hypothetical protein
MPPPAAGIDPTPLEPAARRARSSEVPPWESRLAFDVPCPACGYNLRGLDPSDGACPECAAPVSDALVPRREAYHPPGMVRWARAVLAGLVLVVAGWAMSVSVVLVMPFSGQFGGSVPRLNFLGPKVPAVALQQRGLGYSISSYGVNGVTTCLLAGAGLVLLTTPPTDRDWRDPMRSVRAWARWVPLALLGAFLGLTLGCEGVDPDDPQVRKFTLLAVAAVELPATLLLYAQLRSLARQLALAGVAATFTRAALGAALLMIAAAVTVLLGPLLAGQRNDLALQAFVAAYMAASVCAGAMAIAATVRLAVELAPVAARRAVTRPPASPARPPR